MYSIFLALVISSFSIVLLESSSGSSSKVFSSAIVSSSPSLILNVSEDILEFMSTNEFDNAIHDPNIKTLIMQFPPPSTIGVKDYFYIYNVTDAFITSRPWWSIVTEPRVYNSNQHRVLLERVQPELEEVYRLIASRQFPSDCSKHKLHVRHYGGYGEFGNKISEEGWMSAYAWERNMIYMIIITHSAQFLDPGYCYLYDLNLCAHLPMTNCSLPEGLATLPIDVENNFDKATFDGQLIDKQSILADKQIKELGRFDSSMIVYYYPVRGFNDSSPVYMKKDDGVNIFEYLVSAGIAHRYNSVFRNLIDEEIHKMRVTSKPYFPATEECVAVHVRHFDRHVAGETNIIEWCDKFVHYPNRTCADRYGKKRDCVMHYIGFACDLTPFGSIHFKHYIHAAALILPHVKNIFIMTDDGPWVEHHKHSVQHKFNIYTIHGSNYHTKNSVAGGVNFFASVEAARQCSGFVGHSRSAIYKLMLQYMCTRHGPEGGRKFGQCPPTFDFGQISHLDEDEPYSPPKRES